MDQAFKSRTLQRLNQLLELTGSLLQTWYWTGECEQLTLNGVQTFERWRVSLDNFVERVVGDDVPYRGRFDALLHGVTSESPNLYEEIHRVYGLLEGLRDDIQADFLFERDMLMREEVFSDMLAVAGDTLEVESKDSAAAICGAVLEATLRTLCTKRGLEHQKRQPGLAGFNQLLTDAGVFNKAMNAQVRAWGEIRNAAAHGEFGAYSEPDVARMIDGVRQLGLMYFG